METITRPHKNVYSQICLQEREEIACMLEKGMTQKK